MMQRLQGDKRECLTGHLQKVNLIGSTRNYFPGLDPWSRLFPTLGGMPWILAVYILTYVLAQGAPVSTFASAFALFALGSTAASAVWMLLMSRGSREIGKPPMVLS